MCSAMSGCVKRPSTFAEGLPGQYQNADTELRSQFVPQLGQWYCQTIHIIVYIEDIGEMKNALGVSVQGVPHLT